MDKLMLKWQNSINYFNNLESAHFIPANLNPNHHILLSSDSWLNILHEFILENSNHCFACAHPSPRNPFL